MDDALQKLGFDTGTATDYVRRAYIV